MVYINCMLYIQVFVHYNLGDILNYDISISRKDQKEPVVDLLWIRVEVM